MSPQLIEHLANQPAMVTFFIFDLQNAISFGLVGNGMPVSAVGIGCGELGRVCES